MEHFSQSFMGRVYPAYGRCLDCQLLYVTERPRAEAVLELYRPLDDQAYLEEWDWRQVNDKVAVRQLKQVLPGGRVLEIGCGQGSLTLQLQSNYHTTALDLSLTHLQQGKELGAQRVLIADGGKIPFENDSFNGVVAMHVLEHAPQPSALITEALRVLKPGGILMLETPDPSGLLARLAKEKWWYLMPYHLHLWPKKTLKTFLEQQGFEVLKAGIPQRVWNLGYLLSRAAAAKESLRPLAEWVNQRNLARIKLSLRPPDLVRVIARKPLPQTPKPVSDPSPF